MRVKAFSLRTAGSSAMRRRLVVPLLIATATRRRGSRLMRGR
jgi:hypothetical protein